MRRWCSILLCAVAGFAGCKKERRHVDPDPPPARVPATPMPLPAELPACQGRDCLPELVLDVHGGSHLDTSGLRGQVVVVLVCAVWAMPCDAEVKVLSDLQQRLAPQGLASLLLMVNEGEPADVLDGWARQSGVTLPLIAADSLLIERFGQLSVVPSLQLYGRDGHLLEMQTGSSADLEPAVTRALAVPIVSRGAPTR